MTQGAQQPASSEVLVRRRGEDVVIAMSRERAESLASALTAGDAGNDWLNNLADQLYLVAAPPPEPSSTAFGPTDAAAHLNGRDHHTLNLDRPALADFIKAMSRLQPDTAQVAAGVEAAANSAVRDALRAVESAADKAAQAARRASFVRDAAVNAAAADMLATVREAALVELRLAAGEARMVAAATAEAVTRATRRSSHRHKDKDREAAFAADIASIADATARAMADRTRTRADTMAERAAAAAETIASAAAVAAAAIETEVSRTALAVKDVASRAEHLLAAKTVEAAEIVMNSW